MNFPVGFVRAFVFLFTTFYYVFMKGDKYQVFFMFILMAVYLYMQSNLYLDEYSRKQATSTDFWKWVHQEMKDYHLVVHGVYSLHKPPKKIKYIFMNPILQRVIEDLYFLRIYNQDAFVRSIIEMEYFLKIHYNVIIGKYDVCLNARIMKDLRRTILNNLASISLNTSPVSRIIDIPNIDVYVERRIRDIQGITNKYMNIIRHKFRSKCAHLLEYDIHPKDPTWTNFDLYV